MNSDTTTPQVPDLAHAHLAAIVEFSDDAILSKNLDGIVLSWNPAAERLYGYTPEDMIGQSITLIMPPDRPNEFESIMGRLKRGIKIDHHDTVRIHKHGHRVEVSVSISPITDDNGVLVGAATIARDIGSRKQLEAARRLAEEEREQATERIGRLQQVTAILSQVLTPDQMAETVVTCGMEAMGAWAGLVGYVEADDTFRIISSRGYAQEKMDRWRQFPLSEPYPISDAVRSGRPVWLETHEEYIRRYPNLAAAVADETTSSATIPLLVEGHAIGCFNLSFSTIQKFSQADRDFMQALAHQCAQALERARLYEAERSNMAAAELARQRSAFLAEASQMLASSLDYETTLTNVAHSVVPNLADWCAVQLLDAAGTLKTLAVTHVDPDKVAWALEIQRRYPPEVHPDRGIGLALRTGEPAIYSNISDEMLAQTARDPEHLAAMRQIGLRSVMIVPLVARNRTLGAVTFIRGASGHDYDDADLAEAQDLARRCAIAVDNARLFMEAKRARESAELASSLKDEFLATLSHELRTPLNAILGWTQLLRATNAPPDKVSRGLEIIERNSRAQTQIIEDLLDMSRIISGKIRLDIQTVDLASVIQAAIESTRPAADAKDIRLEFVMDAPVGPIRADSTRLQQVVWNLLSNAVKFTPKGGRVTAVLERVDSSIQISVIDTGPGIRPEFLPYVFDRFRQEDPSTTRTHGGLGLGLSIVKQLAELHGGTVRVRSHGEGQGSTFTVSLPVAPISVLESTDSGAGWQASDITPESRNLNGARLMVVDDEPDSREMVKEALEACGAQVKTAASADEALALIAEFQPAVLLSDIGMPGKDGYALIRELRARAPEQGGTIPAVALTAFARTEDATRALAAGYQKHVAKPAEATTLIAAVAELLDDAGFETTG